MKMKSVLPVLVLALLVSCASAPTSNTSPSSSVTASSIPEGTPSAPDWTSKKITLEGDQLIFVLQGPLDASVPDLALVAMRAYLDLPVGPKTPAVAARAIEEFLASVSQTPPQDKFTRGTTTWWKVPVSRAAWDQARTHLKALAEGTASDPVGDLERVADELFRQGRYTDAVTGYVAMAAAAVAEGRPTQPARFRTALDKAQGILSQLTITSTTPSQTTQVGQPFAATFDVKVAYGSGVQAPVVAGLPLRFNYKALQNGRPAMTGTTVKTNDEGLVQFELPAPDFASQDSLVVLVDVSSWLELLASTPKDLKPTVAGLETTTAERRLLLPYIVESASKKVPMFVSLADFDERGVVLRRQETTTVLISGLQKAGFQASSIPVNPTLLKSSSENVILAAWKFQGKTTGRAVYGTVSLVSATAANGQFSAEVAGTVKVVDLATNKPVYQARLSKIAAAADKATAITNAFRQWATEASATLADELP